MRITGGLPDRLSTLDELDVRMLSGRLFAALRTPLVPGSLAFIWVTHSTAGGAGQWVLAPEQGLAAPLPELGLPGVFVPL